MANPSRELGAWDAPLVAYFDRLLWVHDFTLAGGSDFFWISVLLRFLFRPWTCWTSSGMFWAMKIKAPSWKVFLCLNNVFFLNKAAGALCTRPQRAHQEQLSGALIFLQLYLNTFYFCSQVLSEISTKLISAKTQEHKNMERKIGFRPSSRKFRVFCVNIGLVED